jgi:phospholipid/cholesterol/gamma-HCH transport system substrate-binding protein
VPSQKQLHWSQLRVGVTVMASAMVLAVLIFLMSGTTGIFSKTIHLYCYVDNASGLRNGAPVRLQSVDIGNVEGIRIINHHEPDGASTPVQITMKVNAKFQPFLHTDSKVLLTTAGVLGETFIDIDSNEATGPVVANNAVLLPKDVPNLQDVVRASQSTLQNVDVVLHRLDNIVAAVQDKKGTVGELIYDRQLYNNLNKTVLQVNSMISEVNHGRGSLGKLLNDDALYNRANDAIDKVNLMVDNINNGKGTVGKLINDPTLYNNANDTISRADELMKGINEGHGALGKFATDKEFARKLDLLITNLQTISADLNAGKGSAGKLLKDPSLYNNLDSLMSESRNLVAAIRKNPKKYLTIHLKIF